jgi:hypothetical protein
MEKIHKHPTDNDTPTNMPLILSILVICCFIFYILPNEPVEKPSQYDQEMVLGDL